MEIKEILLKGSSEIASFYQEIRTAKSFDIRIPTSKEYEYLLAQGVLNQSDQRLSLNYSFPTCIIFSYTILDDPSFELPTDLEGIGHYTKRVLKEANQHGVTTGTSEFKKHLMKEMIINCFATDNDISDQILSLKKPAEFIYRFADPIAMAIPALPFSLDKIYRLHAHIYEQVHDQGGYQHVFLTLRDMAKKFGNELLFLAVGQKNMLQGYVMNILLGLYQNDKQKIWSEIEAIDKTEYQIEIINAIANFQFENENDVNDAVDYLNKIQGSDLNAVSLAWAFCNIINSTCVTPEVKSKFIEDLTTLASRHEQAQPSVIRILERLNVDDNIKYNILEKLNFKNSNLHAVLGWSLEKFAPALCFAIMRKVAIAMKLDFKSEPFEYALRSLNTREPKAFSDELTALLTDNLGMVRFGGSGILQQINSKQQPFMFQNDTLQLSEGHQKRFIDAVLLDFMHPDNVIKFILPFRNTTHPRVLQHLVNSIAEITEDYTADTIKTLRSELNSELEIDKQVLDMFEKYTSDLSEIIEKKNKLEEFSPNNSALEVTFFERLLRDKMRRQLNTTQDSNSIFNMVHKVSIARGKSWKTEKHNSSPSPLSLISTAITFPRVCLMNPDEYNWRMMVRINTNYRSNG